MKKQLFIIIALVIGAKHAQSFEYTSGSRTYICTVTSSVSPRTVMISKKSGETYTGSLTIPTSVTYQGDSYRVTSIGSFAGIQITGLMLPRYLQSISTYAFSSCTNLRTVTFNGGNSVTIGDNAFNGCTSLQTLYLSESVTTIGSYAFKNCTSLTNITSPSQYPPTLGTLPFENVPLSAAVHIPCGSLQTYFIHWTCLSNFIEAAGPSFSVITSDINQGNVIITSQPTCSQPTAIFTAVPTSGFRFDHWNDNNTDNPRVLTVTQDTSLVAYFVQDTSASIGTTYIYIHDTIYIPSYINHYIHDTTFVNRYFHDTIIQHVNHYVHDTSFLTRYYHDTVMQYVNYYIHDTLFFNNYIHDTVINYINNYIHDTSLVMNYIHDTILITNQRIDTTIFNRYLYDTTFINIHYYDTVVIYNYQHDTTLRYVYDTVYLLRYISDTVFIHDTIYNNQEGVFESDIISAKIYTNNGQIVVEGASGNDVQLFDISGRLIATRRDDSFPLRFDVPIRGSYLIKIGCRPARKIVVL